MESIKVGVRVRPYGDSDKDREALCLEGKEITVPSQPGKAFCFDHCFAASDGTAVSSNASQEEIFAELGQNLVSNLLHGFNGCLFVYGQTGSGKSYTVMGLGDQPGLIPRSLASVFTRKAQVPQADLRVWVSYLEIYNEQVRDLLSLGDSLMDLKIVDHPRMGVCIPALTEAVCETAEDVKSLLEFGMIRRVVAATHMNDRSSRSHAAFIMKVQSSESPNSAAKVTILDLAGSERQAVSHTEGLLLKEGCAINQGLSALALVVKELGDQQAQLGGLLQARATRYQVGFRTSRLALLMKDALSGNSKTSMIATVSANEAHIEETLSTLVFASSVAKVQTSPVQMKVCKSELLEQLQDEVCRLQEHHAEGIVSSHPFSAHIDDMEMLIASLVSEYDAEVARSREISQARKAFLVRQGIAESFGEEHGLSRDVPYFLNMSDDPMVVGCLCYRLPPNRNITVGSEDGNSIPLQGLGIVKSLCKIMNVSNVAISIEKTSAAGRVSVNGRLLQEGSTLQLRHGDKIYLGRAYAFRLIVPLGMDADDGVSFGLSLAGLEDEWSAIEDSSSWLCLQEYLDQVSLQMQPEQSRQLYEDMKRACKLCDEANEITGECRADDNFHFEVDLTSTVPSSIVMRVLQADMPVGEGDQPCYGTLYLWSVPQMAERLERMRDYHEAKLRNGYVEVDPLLDPWYEAHPGAVARRLNELEMLVQVEREQSAQLREKKFNNVSKTLTLRKRGDVARCVFGGWAQAASMNNKNQGSAVGSKDPAVTKRLSLGPASKPSADSGNGMRKTSFKAIRIAARNPKKAAADSNGRTEPLARECARRQGYMGSTASRSSAGSPKARRTTSHGRLGDAPAQQGGKSLEQSAENSRASRPGSPSKVPPPLKLPCRGSSPTDPRAAEVAFVEALRGAGQSRAEENASRSLNESVSLGDTPQGKAADMEEITLGATNEEGWAAENDMLRKELEAAWHLCNVLRSKMTDADADADPGRHVARQVAQVGPPPAKIRSRSAEHPILRGRDGSVGESLGAMPSGTLLSPRSGQGSNGALNAPAGSMYSPGRGHSSNGHIRPLAATPRGAGSMVLPIAQQATVISASSIPPTATTPTRTVMYQHPKPLQAHQVKSQAGSISIAPPQARRPVERLVSSPLPSAAPTSGRAWSFFG